MSNYVCVEPDTASTGCLEWAQAWSLVDLPMDAAITISSAVVLLWAMAWGFRLLMDFILNRSR